MQQTAPASPRQRPERGPLYGGSHSGTNANAFVQVTAMVGQTSHRANRPILIEGDPLAVRLSRSRRIKVAK